LTSIDSHQTPDVIELSALRLIRSRASALMFGDGLSGVVFPPPPSAPLG
jgi:hypothetical protein